MNKREFRDARDNIEYLEHHIEELKIELQQAIEQRDMWKERCESMQRDRESDWTTNRRVMDESR